MPRGLIGYSKHAVLLFFPREVRSIRLKELR